MFRARVAATAGLLLALSATAWMQSRPRERTRHDEILGTVAGRAITRSEVDQLWRVKDPATFFRFEQQRHEMTMHALREIMADALLKREAIRRGTTVDDLIAAEVKARARPATDEAIKQEFERMQGALPYVSLEDARALVVNSLNQQQAAEARLAFVEALFQQSSDAIEIYEQRERQEVRVDATDPSAGPADAPLTLVVFSDFQCPYCQQLEPTLAALQARYGSRLRLVWKDFPLPIHPDARAAAKAARCAGEQDAFWRYRDELFKSQSDLSEARLRAIAGMLDLDVRAFADCLRSGRFDSVIEAKINEGRQLGVASTPTMFINGAVLPGVVPLSRLESVIGEELRLAAGVRAAAPPD